MLAIDQERPCEAERHLGHAGEVLAVALDEMRVERELADVLQPGAGRLCNKCLALGDHLRREIVGGIARDARHKRLRLGNGVVHRELEAPEGPRLERDLDLMLAQPQRGNLQTDGHDLAEGKGDRLLRCDLVGAQDAAVVQMQRDRRARYVAAIDTQAAQSDEFGVAESVLDRELHAAIDIFKTSDRIELL